ncbi:MAG: PepSY domain-containing protein [Gemmatimonadaceae bacterium]|nr:PepSY domain-containing protein [Gemmatimonadaceae bacterium]
MRDVRLIPILALALTATAAGAQKAAPRTTVESQAMLQKEARLSMADARALARRTVPGASIRTGELEREGGTLIYSFDMKSAGKSGIDEVNIDAVTGKLVSKVHETPKDERAEAKADAKAARAAARAKP